MFRFNRSIHRDMVMCDARQRHPQTIPIFDQFRFRPVCDRCDIETVARQNGLNFPDVVEALNAAAFGPKADSEKHAGT